MTTFQVENIRKHKNIKKNAIAALQTKKDADKQIPASYLVKTMLNQQ